MNPALDFCLRTDPRVPEIDSVARWWPRHRQAYARWRAPIERSIAGGFDADRVAWAFASGYQGALRALAPDLPDDVMAAMCVTEETGNRPRDIRTRIDASGDAIVVTGAKRWTTLGPESTLLLVAGTSAAGAPGERASIRIVRVPAAAPGVRIELMPETRFVPEVPHARVHLDAVKLPASALMPGDGYDGCVKPFRTIEDTHVTAAVLAYLLREARARGWAHAFVERVAAALAAFAGIASAPPDSPVTHVVLTGALHWAHQLYAEASVHWASAGDADPGAQRWRRDSALFEVAGGTRTQRAARAWERLARPAPDA